MNRFISLITLITVCFTAWSANYDFYCRSSEGVLFYYKILSEEEKTCEVVTPKSKAYNLESLTFPSSACSTDGITYNVVRVGNHSVQDCDKLTKVVFSEGIKEIGEGVFYGSTNLQYLSIPTTLEKIERIAFCRCTSLSDLGCLTNSPSLKEIGNEAFAGTSVTTFYITKSLESIGSGAFNTDTFVNYENKGENPYFFASGGLLYSAADKNTLLGVPKGRSGQIVVDSNVKVIGPNAFYGCSLLTEVKLPEGLLEIGENAFMYCTGITELVFPQSLQTLGYMACSYMRNIKKVTFGENITTIGERAFEPNVIEELRIPDSVENIGKGAFNYSSCLKKVSFGKGMSTSNFPLLFNHCPVLEEITISESNPNFRSIDNVVYTNDLKTLCFVPVGRDLTEKREIIVIDGTETIGERAFCDTEQIKKVTLPSSVRTLGMISFSNSKIEEIELAEGLNSIGESAFQNCDKLTAIKLPSSVTEMGKYVFQSCTSLVEVSLPTGIKVIPVGLFSQCYNLKDLVLPEGVETISNYVFSGALNYLEVPASIKLFDKGAMTECTLKTMKIWHKNPSKIEIYDGEWFIKNTMYPSEVKLLVPKGTKELYEEVPAFAAFSEIEEFDTGESELAKQTIEWNQDIRKMGKGDSLTLFAEASSGLDIEYTLSDETLAKVENGVLTALAEGTVTVTATQSGNQKWAEAQPVAKEILIVDRWNPEPELEWEQEIEDLPEGESCAINFTFDEAETDPIFEDYDPDVIDITSEEMNVRGEIVNGKRWFITAKKTGTTTLTIYFPETDHYAETEHISKTIKVVVSSGVDKVLAEQQCEVFTISGTRIFKGIRSNFRTTTPGIYVIKSGSGTSKLVMK